MPELEHHDAKGEQSSFSSRYTIESKLGVGGMGVVYKAYDNVLDKPVAVKVLLPNSQADAIIRFHQEAKMAARLSHANILTVLDFGQNEAGDLFLVMDYLDGESLHERLKEHGGHLHLAEALMIILQICAGLQHAHSQGILHRDIKPSNIMLVRDEKGLLQVKIVDFGLAKVEGAEQSLTTTGMRVGSPLYMSPEQAQTDSVDHRADIYSLGCLMFKTLTGKVPIFGETFLITLNKHVSEIPKSINEVDPNLHFPGELADIVAKTLEKDPAKRFQSCEALAEALMSLDLSFLRLASQVVPLFEERIDLPPTSAVDKSAFGLTLYLKVFGGIALAICIAFAGKALVALFDTDPTPTTLESRGVIDTTTADVLTDNLRCQPDGSLSANPDFGDQDTHELLRFKDVQDRVTLAESAVTGKEFAQLRKMKKLVELGLNDTVIDDASLEHVGKLKKLTKLNLNRDRIGDIGLAHLSRLKHLEELRLERTLITNLGLETLPKLEALQFLDISGCAGVTGAGLDVLAGMNELRTLSVVQCPNIAKADINRFKSNNTSCQIISEGTLEAPPKKHNLEEEEKKALEKEKIRERKRLDRTGVQVFMQYKNDMRDPEFFKFFQDKNCWKPRKTYSDIKNPRIIHCLRNKQVQELMKDPENVKKWRDIETWEHMQQAEDRMRTFFPQTDFRN